MLIKDYCRIARPFLLLQLLEALRGGSGNFDRGGPAPEREAHLRNSNLTKFQPFLVSNVEFLLTLAYKFCEKRGNPGPLSKSPTGFITQHFSSCRFWVFITLYDTVL
jgi:hypothetical protein